MADVAYGIRQNGVPQGRWGALRGWWKSVCDQGPRGPLRSLEPRVHWMPPDLHGFEKWDFDALGLPNDFVRQVVVARRDSGCVVGPIGCGRIWELGPIPGLGPTLHLLLPSLFIRDKVTKTSHILVEPDLIDAEFRKAWMLFFCRSGHPVVTCEQFLGIFLTPFFLRSLSLICLR